MGYLSSDERSRRDVVAWCDCERAGSGLNDWFVASYALVVWELVSLS